MPTQKTAALRFTRRGTGSYEYLANDDTWDFVICRGVRNWTLTITRRDTAEHGPRPVSRTGDSEIDQLFDMANSEVDSAAHRVNCSTKIKRVAEMIAHEFRTLGPGYNPAAEGDPKRLEIAIARAYAREELTGGKL
ncbi:hypothetical protein [Nocardia sp. NPDC057030]|uniref:hypothetical protein n=1 Tax=unclassified Nocardia TaxID=2637762 RepID=UPI00363ABF7F